MKKVIVYLTNLTHINNNIPATESIPLNIGYLAAYAKKVFGGQVEIDLFNLHSDLNEAMKRRKPHILGASNYSWNSNLSYYYLSYYKKRHPDIITVMGGPGFPYKPELRQDFFDKRKLLDFYISGEGEIAFNALLRACLKHSLDVDKIKKDGVPGCHYLLQDKLVSCTSPDRIKHLDIIPSPYLRGSLNKFLEKGFVPILQSNRGCPFSCAYCCSSAKYYNKMTFFNIARVKEEIEYIAKRVKSPSVYIHDDNFGMFERDYEISIKFKETQEKYGWPSYMCAATGKNVKERVIKCVEPISSCLVYELELQSTSEEVLRNIKRGNIRLNDLRYVQQRLKELGITSSSGIILPLPGETLNSHLEGLRTVIYSGVDRICPYTTMLLPGSPLYEEENFDKFQMLKKYRVVPRDFGKYEGRNVVEVEQVCVGTRDLSFDDYIFLRGFHFIICCYYNAETFKELIQYLRNIGLETYDFCYALLSNINTAPDSVKMIFENFLSDTKEELWDSEEDIYKYYQENVNFNKLITQREGYNLLQNYLGVVFASHCRVFLEYGLKVAMRLLNDKKIDYDKEALQSIATYIINSKDRIFDILEEDIIVDLNYDVHRWRQEGFKKSILKYKKKLKLKFSQTEEQRNTIRGFLKIHGNTEQGKGKILSRINPKAPLREISLVN